MEFAMTTVSRLAVYQRLYDEGLVPIFHHVDPATTCRVVDAVAEAGATVCEFVNRSPQAFEAFRVAAAHCSRHLPRMIFGAGSIVDDATAALFINVGAHFIVGPSFNERVARLCNRRRVAYLPGCQTATEIATAEEMGVEIVKLFPARAAGGPDFIRQILGPSPATRLLPTSIGPVSGEALADWFDAGACCVGIGGELVEPHRIAAGDFLGVAARVAEVGAMVRRARGSAAPAQTHTPGAKP